MKKIALGETMPIEVTGVEYLDEKNRFRTFFRDDDGDKGVVILDVEMPLGPAELKIIHTGD